MRVALVLAVVVAGVLAPASPSTAAPDELRVISEERLTERLTELTLFSPALQRTTRVRVLLPRDHRPSDRPLPVLWLLHGGLDDFRSWTDKGAAEAITDGLDVLVVMPDAGPGGWYADWKRQAAGRQRWETWHLAELRPWIEQRYSTRRDRDGRAVAGLSMGGFGTMHAAARHPDLFGFAAAFSGAVDILDPPVSAVVEASPLSMGGVPGDIFGERIAEEASWRAHNPVDLAANLRHTELQVRTGNGEPGGRHGGGPDLIEVGVYRASTNFHRRLSELGIDHVWDDRGPGAHDWPYWQDDLANTLPAVVAHFERAPHPRPATVEHVAFEPTFSVWGHDVALDRAVLEATVLTVRPDGFALRGTGSGTVTTDARFRRGQRVLVEHDTGGSRTTVELVADPAGRLQVPVDLGPASLVDEYPVGGLAAAPRTVEVRFLGRATGGHRQGATASADTSEPAAASPAPTLPVTGGRVPTVAFVAVVIAGTGLHAALRRGRRRTDS